MCPPQISILELSSQQNGTRLYVCNTHEEVVAYLKADRTKDDEIARVHICSVLYRDHGYEFYTRTMFKPLNLLQHTNDIGEIDTDKIPRTSERVYFKMDPDDTATLLYMSEDKQRISKELNYGLNKFEYFILF